MNYRSHVVLIVIIYGHVYVLVNTLHNTCCILGFAIAEKMTLTLVRATAYVLVYVCVCVCVFMTECI
jgi:hypothetical protein